MTENAKTRLMLCGGTGCESNHSLRAKETLEAELIRRGLSDTTEVVVTGCYGLCARGPIMVVQPDGIFYQGLQAEAIPRIVEEHLVGGTPVAEFTASAPETGSPLTKLSDVDFFRKQRLVALANRGLIDPENIEDYIGRGGYAGAVKAFTLMSPEDVVGEVKASGLCGRGGAGFPTGVKWDFARKATGSPKYVICNADEGDPGAFMDRSIIESDPHAIIEGMLIGARAIGANQGFVYIRDEYPMAVQRIHKAIDDARSRGLLGDNILGTGISFDLSVNRGAGAFVCGEETSLIASLEGDTPEPRTRPPFPAESGYMGHPTNINNAETWSNIPRIISRGAEWFAAIGTGSSKGTKVFSIVGKVVNSGLIEVPMGISLRDIVFEIGGGIKDGKTFKAVQTGGPSGGCLPESMLDTPIDYESLRDAGAIMGSGGMIVMDEDTCMVEVARYFLSFTQDESCGKCPPCREGTRHMRAILTNITEGKGQEGDIELLETMGNLVKETALCGLGNTAPNPVLTTIRYFRDEYEAHIRDKRCPAHVCKPLITYTIEEEPCIGCHACFKVCPAKCIAGEVKKPHVIDQEKCVKCGMCMDTCKFNAVRCD